MQYYRLRRDVDETGNSGTGYVAEVIVGGPGTAIVLWSEESNALGVASVVIYPGGLAEVEKVHGHGGKTVIEPALLTPERRGELVRRLGITKRKIEEVLFEGYGPAISYSSNSA